MKAYQWFRGLLKGSAIVSIMFVMQACYGAPHPMDDPYPYEEESSEMMTDSVQSPVEEVLTEAEAQ